MADEWTTVPLSTIATVRSGKRLPPGQKLTSRKTAHPYVRLVDIHGNRIRKENMQYLEPNTQKAISRYIIRSGDVCLAIVGNTIGLVFQVEEQWDGANLTENAARLTDFRGADPTFVFSYLRSQLGQELIKSRTVGSAQGKLPLYAIASFPIQLPPLAEQKAIAHVLGTLDDKIELNRKMNATLEAMARALFQSWFVDFDPVRAKLDGRQPAGIDAATAALFPSQFQESELGEIPGGWCVGSLGELVQCRTDRVDATPAKNAMRYIALEDMPSKSIDLSNFQLGSAVNSSIIAFDKGDILFGSMRPYFHKVGLASFDGITRTTTFVLRPQNNFLRHFALFHFSSDDVIAFSTTASVGTTIPYVKWSSLESYRIIIPPNALLEAFEKEASSLVQRTVAQGKESRTLAALRDTLLPKLLSGELSVPEAMKEAASV